MSRVMTEKRGAPIHGFIVKRRSDRGLFSLITFFCAKRK